MASLLYTTLETRGLLAVTGPDARKLLQGVISNDINKVAPERAIYATLLSAQGKYLHDFFVALLPTAEVPDRLVIDCEQGRLADLVRRLTMYRLRANVQFNEANQSLAAVAIFGDGGAAAFGLSDVEGAAAAFGEGVAFVDPRLSAMGVRAILPRETLKTSLAGAEVAAGSVEDYHRLRLTLGLPDGSNDIAIERYFPLECGFEELNAIDYKKGCYVGQELTARTHYRGTIRKRLLPVDVDGPLPAPGTPILYGERQVGEIKTGADGRAIAMVRLDEADDAEKAGISLMVAGQRVRRVKPAWVKL
ncbi:MAG: folate-binding protein [Alphaproteobacteria bacterium]|nr:folate-binding protein [Alphaproteobacteria bacterium]